MQPPPSLRQVMRAQQVVTGARTPPLQCWWRPLILSSDAPTDLRDRPVRHTLAAWSRRPRLCGWGSPLPGGRLVAERIDRKGTFFLYEWEAQSFLWKRQLRLQGGPKS